MPEGCREIYHAQGEKREGVCHQERDVHTLEKYHHASDGECAVYIEPMHIIGLQWNYAFWMLVKVKRRLVLPGKPTITHQTITHQLHQRRMQERWDIGRR